MDLRGIGIYLTYQCNAQCVHCAYGSGPRLKGVIEEVELETAFDNVNRFGKLETVKILGGEPTLYMDRLLRTVELARWYGATKVILITSGWWGKSSQRATNLVRNLRDAGLSVIVISADAFHDEYLRLQDVAGAIRAAANSDMAYCVTVDVIESIDGENPYDRRSRAMLYELVAELPDISFPVLPSKVSHLGRAAEFLTHFGQVSETTPNDCRPPYAGSFENPSGIAIDPLGYVTLCHGIAIGNTRKRPLAAILAGYTLEGHPILRAIAKEGPLGLMKLAGAEGLTLKNGYNSACHLCYDLRKRLKDQYPDYLAPNNCYASLPNQRSGACHSPQIVEEVLAVADE